MILRCRVCGMPARLCDGGPGHELVDLDPAEDDDVRNMLARDEVIWDDDEDDDE